MLELGGSDPFIVLPSADLDRAVAIAVKARMVNAGQSCIAAKRFIVAERSTTFTEAFVAAMERLVVGDPFDPTTEVGPLATAAIRDAIAAQVARSVAAGARVLCGGERSSGPGFYYAPTVLTDVPRDGPRVRATRSSVRSPCSSGRRLSMRRWPWPTPRRSGWAPAAGRTTPTDRAARARAPGRQVFVNGMVASDAGLPFGGVKRSGYGRELSLRAYASSECEDGPDDRAVWLRTD